MKNVGNVYILGLISGVILKKSVYCIQNILVQYFDLCVKLCELLILSVIVVMNGECVLWLENIIDMTLCWKWVYNLRCNNKR